ncbi:hypothetical protein VMCG_05153 [Cytospora schulzeri]|uniref:Uncharacterized protein n=1 Tax=Cytospora schulzeri TaxID=448051 RepID=A0A423WQY4_9PEZI|nr:hypothetical protein VMCG_05153 [Valsa malicola]
MAVSTYYDSFSQQPTVNESPEESLEQTQGAIAPDVNADLSYRHNARGHSLNNPPPDGWVYPHKKGIGTGSNLEPFKADILARTERGENCKAIAEALNTMGVQTSDRAVSRVRIKWGMRKRAQRKVKTPPPGSEAARLSAKSKVQALRKSELIRMTKEGMSAESICQNLTNRGMELKKGVATVLRLQSAWGLAHDEKRWLGNYRHQCHKKAKAQQLEAFTEIAKELTVQDLEAWLQEKMSEEPARQARHELALKLMGEHAPTNPERRKLQMPRRTDGPYDRPSHVTGASELSDSDTSDSDADSDGDSPPPVKRLRSGVVDPSTRIAESKHNNDVSSSGMGDGTGVSIDHASYLTDIGMDMNDGYASLNGHGDDDAFDAEGDQEQPEGMAHISDGGPEHVYEVPQATAVQRPLRMYDPRRQHDMDSSRSPPATDVTPAKRGKGRLPKQDTAKSTPTPASATLTSSMQANTSLNQQLWGQSVASPIGITAAPPATTSATFALASPTATAPTMASHMPQLILRTEEAEANRTTLSTLDQYNVAAKEYKELLEARNENKPLPGSLTGLPPSAKEVDAAKRKLKEATQVMMLALD